ncbi:hypothetical protein H5410_050569 [Solanum commersonii]|uniref:Uncharacterized protein n=1 Tax=Solanum commersonii TaxID=4109 RepID=A0A9J5WYA1_SOLCO|nr:hypothetical protein H5410_050569 [Solanum commersonii]
MGNRWIDCVKLEVVGTKGGMIVIWDKRRWVKVDSLQGCHTTNYMLENPFKSFRWCCTCIYGTHTNLEKDEIWNELLGVRGLWDNQWVIGGDFSVCIFDSIAQGDQEQ